jgi:hypothetical protein
MASTRTIGVALSLLACATGVACGGHGVSGSSPGPDAGFFDSATPPLDDSGTDAQHSEIPEASTETASPLHDAMQACPGMDQGARDGAPRVPTNHRASAVACPMQRGPGSTGGLPPGDCDADTDCTAGANGRCLPSCGPPGCFASDCSYDGCFNDSECGGTIPCSCRPSVTSSAANTCLTGSTCAVDSDCGHGGYCSPSGASDWCGGASGKTEVAESRQRAWRNSGRRNRRWGAITDGTRTACATSPVHWSPQEVCS